MKVDQKVGAGDDTLDQSGCVAALPVDPGFVLHEVPLLRLRALLARARGDATAYAQFRDRYRKMATSLGFEGHMKWAEAMP